MLRRISLIAASVAMLAISALPASAATAQASAAATTTHKIAFPALRGVKAWGTYTKTSKGVKLYVCDEDTVNGVFASGGVALDYSAGWKLHTNLGAVAIGYHQTVCRTMTVHYTAHLMVYTATWTKTGRVGTRSPNKVLY
jgi:hypothetical protein